MSHRTHPGLRWAVPAGVAALVVGGVAAGPALTAAADVELPERSAAQLLTDLQTADVEAFSGTVRYSADLGLPALPDGMSGREHSTDLASLLDGDHELRVWASGHRGRIALEGELGEFVVVSDGTEVWTWSSDTSTATRLVLPGRDGGAGGHDGLPPVTPEQVTDLVLRRLEPTTTVTRGPDVLVAGRAAYELVIQPREAGSLVGAVRIAVDAEERVPTRVRVLPTGSDVPALEVAFATLDLRAPDDGLFAFTPPPGATVEERTVPDHRDAWHHGDASVPGVVEDGHHPDAADRVALIGQGWSAVLVARAPDGVDATGLRAALGEDADAVVRALPRVSGDWGSGRLLTSRLFSALLTDDGRLVVGAVDGAALQAAAGDPAAALG